MVEKFKFSLIVAGEQAIYIIQAFGATHNTQIELPKLPKEISNLQIPTDKVNVAWALSPHKPYEPFVLFSHGRLVYIFNICTKTLEGCLRGHGEEITSIVVHPHAAHIFCTTSRDLSCRIYDLTRKPQSKPDNLHWLPDKRPSLAGPAHGLDMAMDGKKMIGEGEGIGRCVLVLVGCRSGGHSGAVLGAAFNPFLPVIATCGLDRAIKIWHIPYFSKRSRQRLLREDKPLFSSSMIHKSRVLSVNWLVPSSDILLTHSAPAPMYADPFENSRTYGKDEPGSLVLWTWLSAERFFPAGRDESASQQRILCGFGSVSSP
ncbi:hypothetical protein BT96DRAFT_808578 [Gymnopus androsaceus JB14]|uniref:Uncharacterized protein n=1 Tax=Gymnopus androsaceus JB14 TaxID=1447944 RepID=A0A6A4I7Z8_9AGAR|nr:hypothetical protein BT96DRAFT_808578 [Gymnopus androsaceus JB14]